MDNSALTSLCEAEDKFRVEADTQTPKVAYRETIKGQAEVQGKHKKQLKQDQTHMAEFSQNQGAK